jgi:hypothetical protein
MSVLLSLADMELTTTEVSEGNHLYFTTARARNSISPLAPLLYSSGTGALTLGYTGSLTLKSSMLDTVQDISTLGAPTFEGLASTKNYISVGSGDNRSVMIGGVSGVFDNTFQQNLRNVMLGYCGNKLMTGTDNCFIGNFTGTKVTTGGYNVGIGSRALSQTTDGSHNVAIGNVGYGDPSYSTLIGTSFITGSHNNTLGYQAGNLTSGNFNQFIGSYSGLNNRGGSKNVYIGMQSGGGGASGTFSNNVCIGAYAGVNSQTNSNNTIVGAESAASLTVGNNNTLFGYQSGFRLTTGNNNVLLGNMAGTLLTTGSGNVFIGPNSGASTSTESNLLSISNTSTSTPLIGGDFSSKVVTIHDTLVTANAKIGSVTGIMYRVSGVVRSDITVTTTFIPEGINLYYTDTRVHAAIKGGDGITSSEGLVSVRYNTENLKTDEGVLNTTQDIGTTSCPSFAGLRIGSGTGITTLSTETVSIPVTFNGHATGSTVAYIQKVGTAELTMITITMEAFKFTGDKTSNHVKFKLPYDARSQVFGYVHGQNDSVFESLLYEFSPTKELEVSVSTNYTGVCTLFGFSFSYALNQ